MKKLIFAAVFVFGIVLVSNQAKSEVDVAVAVGCSGVATGVAVETAAVSVHVRHRVFRGRLFRGRFFHRRHGRRCN